MPDRISPAQFDYYCQPAGPQGLGFCVPTKRFYPEKDNLTNSYYVAAPKGFGLNDLFSAVTSIFGKREWNNIQPVQLNARVNNSPETNLFDVTGLLPPIVPDSNMEVERYPGPNCFYAVLKASGVLEGDKPRYIDELELRYYLTRHFRPAGPSDTVNFGVIVMFMDAPMMSLVRSSEPPIGSIRYCSGSTEKRCLPREGVHSSRFDPPKGFFFKKPNDAGSLPVSALYEGGTHAAITLPGGFVFQKLSWGWNDRYESVPAEDAMINVENQAYDRLRWDERPAKVEHLRYTPVFYKRGEKISYPQNKALEIDAAVKGRFMMLFDFYSDVIEKCEDIKPVDFPEKRLNLITVENVWAVLKEFEDEAIKAAPSNLLFMDEDIAKAYLKLRSLSWQYEAFKETYAKSRARTYQEANEELKAIYRRHYLGDPDLLWRETVLHFVAGGVTEDRAKALATEAMKKIAEEARPVIDSASGRVDFRKIINDLASVERP